MSEMLTQHEAESIILHHYGQAKQEIQAVQELSELTLLLAAREDQRGEDYKEHLTEEMADVIVMIEQMKIANGITDSDYPAAWVQAEHKGCNRYSMQCTQRMPA